MSKSGNQTEVSGATELYDDALNEVTGGDISFWDWECLNYREGEKWINPTTDLRCGKSNLNWPNLL